MITITPAKVKFLKNGHPLTVEVPNPRRYRIGRPYTVAVTGRRETHRAVVHARGDGAITILYAFQELALVPAQRSEHGYIEVDPYAPNLYRAMPHEPEAVDPRELTRINRRRAEQTPPEPPAPDMFAARRLRSLELRERNARRRKDWAELSRVSAEHHQLSAQMAETYGMCAGSSMAGTLTVAAGTATMHGAC